MYRYFLLVFLLLFSAGKGSAQLPLLRHYTVNDGMPSNNVYTVSQDSKGFIWLFTDWGISRFDGRHFENITSNDGLPDNDVFKGCEDPWQRYWLFCYNRVPAYIYNGKVYGPHNDSLCRWMERRGMRYTNAFVNERNEFCLAGKQNYIVGKNGVKPAEAREEFKTLTASFFYKGRTFFMDETHFFSKDSNGYTPIAHVEEGAFKATLIHEGHIYIVVAQDKQFKSRTKVFYDIDLDNLQKGVKEVHLPYTVFCFVRGKNGAVPAKKLNSSMGNR